MLVRNDAMSISKYLIVALLLFAAKGAFSQCAIAHSNTSYEHISNFTLNTITNTSGASSYTDYSSLNTNLLIGSNYNFSITNPVGYNADSCAVFIDWNQDGDFSDASETVYRVKTAQVPYGPQSCTYNSNFTVPAGALVGPTRLRVRVIWASGETVSDCGTRTYGEAEDYTVNIVEGYNPGSVSSGLQLWLKANQRITPSGSEVSYWWDQSAQGHSANSPAGNRPEYMPSSLQFNFNESLRFVQSTNPTVEHMVIPHHANLNFDQMSVFVVAFSTSTTGKWAPYIIKTDSYNWDQGYGIGNQGTVPQFLFWKGLWNDSGGGIDDEFPNPTLPMWGHPHLMSGFVNAGFYNASLNNGTYTTLPRQATINNSSQQLIIGSYPQSGFSYPTLDDGSGDLDGEIAEIILYDNMLGSSDINRVSSYLAIKYGLTLGINGTSQDYVSSSSAVVWNQSNNSGYNYDIAGIGLDDESELDQPKSHSTNQAAGIGTYNDIVTIANSSNFATPASLMVDESFLVWGHDGDPTHNTLAIVNYPTDNGEIIETIFQREWKSQETGTVGLVTLEFKMADVIGSGGLSGQNDLANLRLLVDEDGDFSDGGATSISPSSFDNVTDIAYFQHDFTPPSGPETTQLKGYYFTLGSIDYILTPLTTNVVNFDYSCQEDQIQIFWTSSAEHNTDRYEILDVSSEEVLLVGIVEAAGESDELLDYYFSLPNDYRADYIVLRSVDNNDEYQQYGPYSISCEKDQVYLYPNPANEMVVVHAPEYVNPTIKLFDTAGKLVLLSQSTLISVKELSAGLYNVEISDLTHKVTRIKLLVK